MRVGQALVRLLERYGVERVFGIPGTHALELYRGLAGSGIRHVLPRHEQGGGFMADGYARISGKPGVCFVITGPGVTNICTALGEASLDCVPLLLISPVNPPLPGVTNAGRLHEISDQAAVTAPLTAFSATAAGASDVAALLHRAFDLFATQRPAPVHINVPMPVLADELPGAHGKPVPGAADPWEARPRPRHPELGERELLDCLAALARSQRAVIVAGGGARRAAGTLLALAERLGAPVITTVAGRGLVPREHLLHPGAQLRSAPVRALLAEADLALLIGTELAETDHYATRLEVPPAQIRINLNPVALRGPRGAVAVQTDAQVALRTLLRHCPAATAGQLEWASARCAQSRAAVHEETPLARRHLDVLQVMLARLPERAVVVSDMTQIAYTAIDCLALPAGVDWLHPTGYGTLGYALPAAIGACLAAPDRTVVALAGDAGFQYTGQEMALAAELGLDIVVLLWDNDALQQIADDMQAAAIPELAVRQRNPDFVAWARACGWRALVAPGLAEFAAALDRALARGGCNLLVLPQERFV